MTKYWFIDTIAKTDILNGNRYSFVAIQAMKLQLSTGFIRNYKTEVCECSLKTLYNDWFLIIILSVIIIYNGCLNKRSTIVITLPFEKERWLCIIYTRRRMQGMHAISWDPVRCMCVSVGARLKVSLVLWILQNVSTRNHGIFTSEKNDDRNYRRKQNVYDTECMYFEGVAIFVVEKGDMRLIRSWPDQVVLFQYCFFWKSLEIFLRSENICNDSTSIQNPKIWKKCFKW